MRLDWFRKACGVRLEFVDKQDLRCYTRRWNYYQKFACLLFKRFAVKFNARVFDKRLFAIQCESSRGCFCKIGKSLLQFSAYLNLQKKAVYPNPEQTVPAYLTLTIGFYLFPHTTSSHSKPSLNHRVCMHERKLSQWKLKGAFSRSRLTDVSIRI